VVSTVPSSDVLRQALGAVHDPHVPVSLERMGMVAALDVDESGVVRVELCIPCSACPGVAGLKEQAERALLAVDGVTGVVVETGFHLPWRPEVVDAEARALMRRNGIQI
jgi:ATP-binding protein involved in chromosome partitioning